MTYAMHPEIMGALWAIAAVLCFNGDHTTAGIFFAVSAVLNILAVVIAELS